jgi:ubiquinone/menaquinone biosynthesis C-methylase UbiE
MESKIYENKNYITRPYKSFFKYKRFDVIKKYIKKDQTILDVGCSKGQLLYFLNKKIKHRFNYVGIDDCIKSIQIANNFFKENSINRYKFIKKDLLKYKSKNLFDLIIISGVLSYYNDYNGILRKFKNLLKKDGTILIFNKFHSGDDDLIIRLKKDKIFNYGMNIFSKKNFIKNLKNNFNKIEFQRFNIQLKRKINKFNTKSLKINKINYFYNDALKVLYEFYYVSLKK